MNEKITSVRPFSVVFRNIIHFLRELNTSVTEWTSDSLLTIYKEIFKETKGKQMR